jgi:hypothetical protein
MEDWFATAQALPGEDEAIRFIVGQRGVPLYGQFREGLFRSRWWSYAASQVRNWSAMDHVRSGPKIVAADRAFVPCPTSIAAMTAGSNA